MKYKSPLSLVASICLVLTISLTNIPVAEAQVNCGPGSRYLQERERGVEGYRLRHNQDLQEVLIDNPPDLDNIFEGCVGRLQNIYQRARDLIYGKVGIFTANSLLIELLQDRIQSEIDRECRQIIREAQEAYSDIADVIPAGEYWIDLDRISRGL